MHKIGRIYGILLFISMLFFIGCGDQSSPISAAGGKTMTLPEFGFSVEIPPGWQRDDAQLCHSGDNTGLVMAEPLVNNDYDKTVSQISREFDSEVLYEEDLKIPGSKGTVCHLRTPGGVYCIRGYVLHGKHVILVSYSLESKEAFESSKNAIQKSLSTIKFKK